MFFAASSEIGLHGGAQGIDVAVGMTSGEIVAAFGERV